MRARTHSIAVACHSDIKAAEARPQALQALRVAAWNCLERQGIWSRVASRLYPPTGDVRILFTVDTARIQVYLRQASELHDSYCSAVGSCMRTLVPHMRDLIFANSW